MPTSEKRLDYICEVEASSRFGGVGRTQQNAKRIITIGKDLLVGTARSRQPPMRPDRCA